MLVFQESLVSYPGSILTAVLFEADSHFAISRMVKYKLILGLKGLTLGPKLDTRVYLRVRRVYLYRY